eukprot:m.93360 g.93360  ORF g.93360 m.93360 type:complete len:363 (-) comp12997_c1_seq1:1098-2186(-)
MLRLLSQVVVRSMFIKFLNYPVLSEPIYPLSLAHLPLAILFCRIHQHTMIFNTARKNLLILNFCTFEHGPCEKPFTNFYKLRTSIVTPLPLCLPKFLLLLLNTVIMFASFLRTARTTVAPGLHRAARAQQSASVMFARTLFVQTKSTPNPNSLMFYPGEEVTGAAETYTFTTSAQAHVSPLARTLFRVDGVTSVFLGSDFVTVSKSDTTDWELLKPHIYGKIMDFYASNQPVLLDSAKTTGEGAQSTDQSQAQAHVTREDEDDVVLMIKELLDDRIRPAVQDDGGDITFVAFENGIVKLRLSGACDGCPSSSFTLKNGVENMLMHYIDEVDGVEQVTDDELDAVNSEAFAAFEASKDKDGSQ